MKIDVIPVGETDSTKWITVDAVPDNELPQVIPVPAGQYTVQVRDGDAVIYTVTDTPLPGMSARKVAGTSAYLEGDVLGDGVEAVTLVFDVDVDPSTNGSLTLMEVTSTALKVVVDRREGKGQLNITAMTLPSGGEFPGEITPTGSLPPGKNRVVTAFSTNSDGDGMAAVKCWINGVEHQSRTTPALNPFVPGKRVSRVFQPADIAGTLYEFSLYAGLHAEGFAGAGGDVSGLALKYTVFGSADEWNAPGAGLTKRGEDLFT